MALIKNTDNNGISITALRCKASQVQSLCRVSGNQADGSPGVRAGGATRSSTLSYFEHAFQNAYFIELNFSHWYLGTHTSFLQLCFATALVPAAQGVFEH